VDTVYVSNTSNVDVDVIDAVLSGPNMTLFTVLNPAVATNVTLAPGQRIGIAIQFDPRGSTDGAKTATLTVRARIANQPTSFLCAISGTRATSIPSTPEPVVFGLVDVLQSSNQTLTIVNTGLLPVRITGIRIRGTAGGVFTVTGPGLPINMQPADRIDVRITFRPTDAIGYLDSLLIDFDLPCADTKAVALSGTGRLNVEVAVRMPFLTVSPAEDNLVIPIKAEIVAGAVTSINADARFIIRSATPAFVVQRVSGGTIVRNESVAGITELEIVLSNLVITDNESVITELIGQATLGSVDSTELDLAFADMTFAGAKYTTRPEDGWLKLDICREGGNRLVKKSGALSMSPLPSPAHEALNVHVEVFERGVHRLELVDVNGLVLDAIEWQHAAGDAPHTEQFDVRRLASGPYTIRLITPTRQRHEPVLIIH
jgi:hypothetical protein